jgi:hypothetical protein
MSQLTADQRASLRAADADGRALVTEIDGRLAIILPMPRGVKAQADLIARVAAALGPIMGVQ